MPSLLYPAGHYASQIQFAPSVTYPAGWTRGTRARADARRRRHRGAYKHGAARHPGRLAGVSPAATSSGSTSIPAPRAGAPGHRRRRRQVAGGQARAARRAPALVEQALQAVRRAPLRPLRLPVLADRPDGRQRPGAPALQRGRRGPDYFTDWNQKTGSTRPAGARVHPLLERQVPPPAPTCGRRTSTCRCGTACCGSTRARPSTGATCWPRARPAPARRVARRAGAGRGDLCRQPAGPGLAQRAGHHQRSDHRVARAASRSATTSAARTTTPRGR